MQELFHVIGNAFALGKFFILVKKSEISVRIDNVNVGGMVDRIVVRSVVGRLRNRFIKYPVFFRSAGDFMLRSSEAGE